MLGKFKNLILIPILLLCLQGWGQQLNKGFVQTIPGQVSGLGGLVEVGGNANQVRYCEEYKALLATLKTQPSQKIKIAQNKFIETLLGDNAYNKNVWIKLACIIPYAAGMPDSSDALRWWNNPTKKATFSSVSPSYTVGKGFTGNGSSSFIHTKFNPATDGAGKYTQNSASFINYYSNTRTSPLSISSGNYAPTTGVLMSPKAGAGACYAAVNSQSSTRAVTGDVNDLFIATRGNAANFVLYIGTSGATLVRSSKAVVNREIYDLALNQPSNVISEYSTDTKGLTAFGSHLDTMDVQVINTAWYEMLAAINDNSEWHYNTSGTEIDTNFWDITTGGASIAITKFWQDDGIKLMSMSPNSTEGNTSYFLETIDSKNKRMTGSWVFSGFAYRPVGLNSYSKFGLRSGTSFAIEFYPKLDANSNIAYSISINGTSVYEVTDIAKDFGIFKVYISPTFDISVYVWENDTWNQKGITKNYITKPLTVFMATRGYISTESSLCDIYYNKINQESPSSINYYIDVRDYGAIPDGSTDATNSINSALQSGNTIIQNGSFIISKNIIIPSDRTLYIKNARVKMADSSWSAMIRNADMINGNTNISIIGLGNAIIDGNTKGNKDDVFTKHGGLGLDNDSTYKYNTIYMCNVRGFNIVGINIIDHPAYAICLHKSTNGNLSNILFNHYLQTTHQDGIHILWGSDTILANDIRGRTADNFIGLTVDERPELSFNNFANSYTGSIDSIYFRDFKIYETYPTQTWVILNGSGNKITNVKFKDFDIGYSSYLNYFNSDPSGEKGELSDFTFENINLRKMSSTETYAIKFMSNCQNITYSNLTTPIGKSLYESTGGDQDNVVINGTTIFP